MRCVRTASNTAACQPRVCSASTIGSLTIASACNCCADTWNSTLVRLGTGVAVSSRISAGLSRFRASKLRSVLVLCASSTITYGWRSAIQLAKLQRGWPTKRSSIARPASALAASSAVTSASGRPSSARSAAAGMLRKCGSSVSVKAYTVRWPVSSIRKLWIVATTTTAWASKSCGASVLTSSSAHTRTPSPQAAANASRNGWPGVVSAPSVCARIVSLGTSHSASGCAESDGHSRAKRPMACAASSVLPPPVGMRRQTQGTSPKGSGL